MFKVVLIYFGKMYFLFYLFWILVAKLAKEQILPLVREMDDAGRIHPNVVDMLFENGVCDIYFVYFTYVFILSNLYGFISIFDDKFLHLLNLYIF